MTNLDLFKQKRLELEGLQGSVGHTQTFINQGWIEALSWVIGELELDNSEPVTNVPIQGNNARQALMDAFGLTPDNLDRADGDFYLAVASKVARVHPDDVTSDMRTLAKRMMFQEYLK